MKASLRMLAAAALSVATAAAFTSAMGGPPGTIGKPGVWPSKQGAICFSTESGGSAEIRMQVSHMGGGFFFIAGTNDEGPDEGVSRFTGSAEVDGDLVFIHATSSGYRIGAGCENGSADPSEHRGAAVTMELDLGSREAMVWGLTVTAMSCEGNDGSYRVQYEAPQRLYVVDCP